MPIGVLTDCLMVLIGALIGCAAGRFLSEETRKDLNILLGFCAMAIGINSIVKVASMAPVIFSVLIGYTIGAFLHLEELLTKLMGYVIRRLPFKETETFSMDRYITVVVLFAASGFGIYATFVEAMSGDPSIIISKSVLDMMTALVFAISLGAAVAIIPAFMAVVLLAMFLVGHLIAPVVSDQMLQNFTACGGILTLAAGIRVAGIKHTAITNMIPALILVMPMTWLWGLLPL